MVGHVSESSVPLTSRLGMDAARHNPMRAGCSQAPEGTTAAAESRTARWFAVFCLPNQEARAECELGNQSFSTFLPRLQRTIRHARQMKVVMGPLFPCYLFVRLDLRRDRWLSIDGTYGVAHLVRFGEMPAQVPEGVVEALIEATDRHGVIHLDNLLRPGQVVRLVSGPFAEQLGRLDRLDGTQSVRILLEIMGRCVEVKTHRRSVLPA
ncbi:transcription termination/antitermination NusG family protein [Mesorhizobium sp. M0408]|uniref:transcription termination/antitermination NusG family protein n=1 Tax=unclassified Mesorhizobium TaxID=325217 RepID=UPI0033367954